MKKLVVDYGIKCSPDDLMPTYLMKTVIDIMLPIFVELINKSFEEGSVDGVKNSIIDPLHKGGSLAVDAHSSYRPVNNLEVFSKFAERIVLKQLNLHMSKHNLHSPDQFGYKRYCSTEALLLSLTNDILHGFENDKCTIVLFLDLSAAFDTVDIDLLLSILKLEIGIDGIALQWLKSFLTGRTQKVRVGSCFSNQAEVNHGVPQGSILGPQCFNIYSRSLVKSFMAENFKGSGFADDNSGRKFFH